MNMGRNLLAGLAALAFALGVSARADDGVAPESLAGTSWVATQVVGEQMRYHVPPTLTFGEHDVRGELVCNRYSGRYDTYGQHGINVRALIYPREACASTENQIRQNAYLQTLDEVSHFELLPDGRLLLQTHDHRALIFRAAGGVEVHD